MEEVATPEAFIKNPDLVYRFYNARRRQLLTCQPNAAHRALCELEVLTKGAFSLITQNVDDLHERGGSQNLLHMHGELLKARCLSCKKVFYWEIDLDASSKCETCGGQMRPHIVWFNEIPFYLNKINKIISECNLFIAIGTSGLVYPAAGFSKYAMNNGAFTLEINLEETGNFFNTCLKGPATLKVKELVDELKNYNHFWK